MVLSDKNTYQQVLGGLMKNPLLLVDNDIRKEDFDLRIAKIVFTTIQQLFENGAESLTPFEIDTEIEKHEGTYNLYKQDGGLEYVQNCYEYSASENFKVYYERLKKFSLLRILKKNNYDISRYYGENLTIREENEAIQHLDDDSVEDILDNVEAKFTEIRSDFIMGNKKDGDISFGLREMIESFSSTPDIGPAINGSIFNTAIRGARPGIFLLRSCATNVGKTRLAVFDSVKLCFPERWSFEQGTFIQETEKNGEPREPRKTLFITTEMDEDEIRTILVANIAGVNEEHILTATYDLGERERVSKAMDIIEDYKDYYFITKIGDPNLLNVSAIIKKFIKVKGVEYVFFDYIFTSPSLISQFSASKVREDEHSVMSSYTAFPLIGGVALMRLTRNTDYR